MNTRIEILKIHIIEDDKEILPTKWIYKSKLNELKYFKIY